MQGSRIWIYVAAAIIIVGGIWYYMSSGTPEPAPAPAPAAPAPAEPAPAEPAPATTAPANP